MNPENFLEQSDVIPLVLALNNFAVKVNDAINRQNVLRAAGMDFSSLSNIKFDTPSNIFAQALVAMFRNYRVSSRRPSYHPMVSLLKYLSELVSIYELPDQDIALFHRLIERGQDNFKALECRSVVGCIESPIGKGIGTGTLVSKNLLLTCEHIFTKTQVTQAWVHFGYKEGSYGLEETIKLELDFVSCRRQTDYALVKLEKLTSLQPILPTATQLNSGEGVRLIHHPLGKPAVISDLGQILQVGEAYIDHNISTDGGSSGAPIFNRIWELVAFHKGNPGIGRRITKGTSGGIPIEAIWQQINTYLV